MSPEATPASRQEGLTSQRGFTLIEVVVALMLFGITGVLFISMLALGVGGAGTARQKSAARQIARNQLESIKQQPYAEPIAYATVATDDETFLIDIGGSVLIPGILEQIDVTVTYPEGSEQLSGYKVNGFPPVLADFPLSDPLPECPPGRTCPVYYLHNNPTPPVGDTASQAILPMTLVSSPGYVRYNYDTDRDTSPGLTIDKYVGQLTNAKRQRWRTASQFTSPLHLSGDAVVQLWSATDGFTQQRRGQVKVILRDYHPSGSTTIAELTIFRSEWQEGFEDFVIDSFVLPSIDYTITNGHYLELEVQVGPDAQTPVGMWFMYDYIDFDSRLFITVAP
jgi:prepilin-type N-terminal cleavage/methylation domain-containing protein